jgi:hypothetical protein
MNKPKLAAAVIGAAALVALGIGEALVGGGATAGAVTAPTVPSMTTGVTVTATLPSTATPVSVEAIPFAAPSITGSAPLPKEEQGIPGKNSGSGDPLPGM